jgi:hypothetical protein
VGADWFCGPASGEPNLGGFGAVHPDVVGARGSVRFGPPPGRDSWPDLLARFAATSKRRKRRAPSGGLPPSISGCTGPEWCAREDLNLQSFRNQILSLARLPFRHARTLRRHDLGNPACPRHGFCTSNRPPARPGIRRVQGGSGTGRNPGLEQQRLMPLGHRKGPARSLSPQSSGTAGTGVAIGSRHDIRHSEGTPGPEIGEDGGATRTAFGTEPRLTRLSNGDT